jgi:hypothetical protein
MQLSALRFVLGINCLISVGRPAAFSFNINTPSRYRMTNHDCSGEATSDVFLSTVSIVYGHRQHTMAVYGITRALLVGVRSLFEGREND